MGAWKQKARIGAADNRPMYYSKIIPVKMVVVRYWSHCQRADFGIAALQPLPIVPVTSREFARLVAGLQGKRLENAAAGFCRQCRFLRIGKLSESRSKHRGKP